MNSCHALLASTLSLFCVTPLVAQVGVNKAVANFNTAKKKVFANLPHLSAETVAVIQKQRPFPSIAALHKVIGKGLSADQQKELYSKAFIPINLNTATKGELRLIPGMSRKMVHEFEEYRPYKSLAKFRRSIGKYVDKKELARLEQFVFVPLDLNKASNEHLKTIPGASRKMVHEFEEYRPYKTMAQFRREMGKYVSKKEVARFERYFVLPGAATKATEATAKKGDKKASDDAKKKKGEKKNKKNKKNKAKKNKAKTKLR